MPFGPEDEVVHLQSKVERLEAELALAKGAIKAANRMMEALVRSHPLADLSVLGPRDPQSIRKIFFRWAMAQPIPLEGGLGDFEPYDHAGDESARLAAEAMIAELVASSSHPEMHASTQGSTGCAAEAGTAPVREPGSPTGEITQTSD